MIQAHPNSRTLPCLFALLAGAFFTPTLHAESTTLALGAYHSCLRTALDAVVCVGDNRVGQLGDGSTTQRVSPVAVQGLSSGVAAVTAGHGHTCALGNDGGVKCWGLNDSGQLGNGSNTDSPVPVAVTGLGSGVVAIDAGGRHTCAVLGDGSVKCWGSNVDGQLGDETEVDKSVPTSVVELTGIVRVSAGDRHTCAATGNQVYCWGAGENGRLGYGEDTPQSGPISVGGFGEGVGELGAGAAHTCATTSGTVKCWGAGNVGQMGNGESADSFTPTTVPSLPGATRLSVGGYHSCATLDDGTLKCWGANEDAQLGAGSRFFTLVPQTVVGLASPPASVALGSQSSCALLVSEQVVCWGRNFFGQLGNGVATARLVPVPVSGLTAGTTASIALGDLHSCARDGGGTARCWGYGGFGQLGRGLYDDALVPSSPAQGATFGALAAGSLHTCGLTGTGGVRCWGDGFYGQLGGGSNASNAFGEDVVGLSSGVSTVVTGRAHSCALLTTGSVKCWGNNELGQLGTDVGNTNTPVDVSNLTGVSLLAAGYDHTCAALADGGMKCWGLNDLGQIGDGTQTLALTPTLVETQSPFTYTAVSAGGKHTCAVSTEAGLQCWGFNAYGQLGDGSALARLSPVGVPGYGPGGTAVAALGLGSGHTCALTAAGGVKCWGYNFDGQLGDGTVLSRLSPVDVSGLASGVASIGVGASHGCAVLNTGAVRCWGRNEFGQVGDGTLTDVFAPAQTLFRYTGTVDSGYVPTTPLPPPPVSAAKAGSSVGTGGGVVAVGAPLSLNGGETSGEVYLYFGGELDSDRGGGSGSGAPEPGAKAGLFRKALDSVTLATLQMPTPPGPLSSDKFGAGGAVVDPTGTMVIVGAPGVLSGRGAVYVFKKPVDGWTSSSTPTQTITVPGASAGDEFGAALALTNAGTLVVGAPGASTDTGKAYVLRPNPNTGAFEASQTLSSPEPQQNARFGASIAGEGSDLVIGSPGQAVGSVQGAGAVVTFREPSQVTASYPPNLATLISSVNPAVADKFGWSVDIDNGTLLVGAPGVDQPSAVDAGAAFVYEQDDKGDMEPVAKLADPTPDAGAELGTAVDVQDQTLAAGAPRDDVGTNEDQGTVAVFVPASPEDPLSGNLAPTVFLADPDGAAGDLYGSAFVFGGGVAVVGSPDGNAEINPKRAFGKLRGKALNDGNTGEALVYGQNRVFRDGLESPRGAADGCVSPGQAIPDANTTGVTSDLALVSTSNVRSVEVELQLTHPAIGDLEISLTHVPGGITVPLYKVGSACNGADIEVRLSDQAVDGFAVRTCNAFAPALDGVRIPKDWLKQFLGKSLAGPWRLTVKDTVAQNVGTLDTWCVNAR